MNKLYIEDKEVQPGDIIKDFRGDDFKYLYLSSRGTKVYARRVSNNATYEFFPSVFHGVIRVEGTLPSEEIK